jgi:hypothetical protein
MMKKILFFLFILFSFNGYSDVKLKYRGNIKQLSTALISWNLNQINDSYCDKHWILKRVFENSSYFANCKCIVKSLIKLGRAIPFSEEVLQEVSFSKRNCEEFPKKQLFISTDTLNDLKEIKTHWDKRDLSSFDLARIQLAWNSIEAKIDFSRKFWLKINKKLPRILPIEAKILSEVIRHKSLRDNFEEVFKGAHIRILNNGDLYEYFKKLPESSKRKSSHPSDGDQFSIQGAIIPEFLFGKINLKGKGNFFWFQFENSPWGKGAKQGLIHIKDTFKYYAQLKKFNIGPFGKSKFTDKNPLYILD